MNGTINTKSLREQVADALRLQIIHGELKPGDRISERDLSASMNISTSPIKEAFRILETAGLLVSSPRKGTMVSEFAKQSLTQISILRSALEGASAHLATMNMTEAEVDQLSSLMALAWEHLDRGEVEALERINHDFHSLITQCAHNSYLCQLIETQTAFIQGFRHEALQSLESRTNSTREHQKIVEAIQHRDCDLAESLMREHIRNSSQYTLDNISASRL